MYNDNFNKFKAFLDNNKLKIVMTAVAVLLFAFLAGDIFTIYLKPRKTEGYSPERVVESFYKSINILDFDTMDDCVIKGAGKGIIKEVVRLSVVYKQSQALGRQSNLVLIKDWEAMGKVKLEPPKVLYGILDLKMNKETENTFIVSYTKWEYYHNDKNELRNKKRELKEKVFLTADKSDWVIHKIEQM